MIHLRAGACGALAVLLVAAAALPAASRAPAAPAPAAAPRAPTAAEAADLESLTKAFLAAREARRWDEAERAMRRVLAIQEQVFGPQRSEVALTLGALGDTLEETDRYAEAEPLLRRALAIRRTALGDRHPDTALSLNNLAYNVDAQGRYAEAQSLYAEALEITRAVLGERSALTAGAYNNLAANLSAQGKYPEAETLYRKALEIRLAVQGERDPLTAGAYSNLGSVLTAEGRAADAEPMFRKAYEIRKAVLKPGDAGLAVSLNDVAYNLADQGRAPEAEPLLREALAIRLAALGEDHTDTAASRNNLAANLGSQGRYAEAEPLLRAALATFRAKLGERHPLTATTGNNLAANLNAQGRYGEAEPFYRTALAARRAVLGERHPVTATSLNNLAVNLQDQGRYAEAEAAFAEALDIRQAALGEAHPETAQGYASLAAVLNAQGRYAEAEPLFRKALAIRHTALGERHPSTAASEDSLAANLDDQGRFAEAEPLYRHALEARRAGLGERHPLTAASTNNLAYNLDNQGRYAEAEPLYRQALEIRRTALGARHPYVATSLNNLASALDNQGRRREAEALYRKALDIRRATLGDLHPDTATSEANLAFSLDGQARYAEAEAHAATAVDLTRRLRLRERARAADPDDGPQAADDGAPFRIYLATAGSLSAPGSSGPPPVRARAFMAAQDLDRSSAGAALAQAAARVAAGRAGLAETVRRQQDLAIAARGDEARLLQALGDGDEATAQAMRQQLARAGDELARLHAEIRARFPRYAELVSPEPLSLAATRARLKPGEGLLLITPSDKDIHVFALTRTQVSWRQVKGAAKGTAQVVVRLRCQTDPATCPPAAHPAEPASPEDLPPFDRQAAYGLYRDLIVPVEPALRGAKTLYVVTTGALSGLPLSVLQTRAPPQGARGDDKSLMAAPWFAERYALVTLPSVSSLRALGALKAPPAREPPAREPPAREPLVGYGDPVLGNPEPGDQTARAAPAVARGGVRVFRSVGADGLGLADPATLRQGLAPLPGTRAELSAMAAALGAPASALHMGPQATEAAVKASSDLPRARVVIFATHGLLPHVLKGIEEPGLVLTPPAVATSEDDGVLTASEAARLSLSADWVILSACNTAAADGKPGAESLSGLAKAFLYAGAGGLLVSHWQVGDEVTAALTVQTIALQRADPKLSKARALQAAMRALRTGVLPDGKPLAEWQPIWAHPGSWAPFVLVSAGG